MRKHSHYHKNVANLNTIDVYRVLSLWCVSDPALQHAIKKLLNAGQRGMKDWHKDLREAIDSIERALEMRGEDDPQSINQADEHKDTVQIGKVTATFTGPAASGKTRLVMEIENFIAGKPNASVDALIHALVMPTPSAAPAPVVNDGGMWIPAPSAPLNWDGTLPHQAAPEKPATATPVPALDPYERGRAARKTGMLHNPYKLRTTDAYKWEQGYEDEKTANYGKEVKLAQPKFELDVQEYKRIKAEGMTAFGAGWTIGNNPYQSADIRSVAWSEGFSYSANSHFE